MEEKTTVMLSTKSWHYKLLKWTLGKNAPTPQTMHNLCPYFWLVIFSILIQPLFAPIKIFFLGFERMLMGLDYLMDRMSAPVAEQWFDSLNDVDVYMLIEKQKLWDWNYSRFINVYGDTDRLNIPFNFRRIKKQRGDVVAYRWLLEKKKIDLSTDAGTKKYEKWEKTIEAKLRKMKENEEKMYQLASRPQSKMAEDIERGAEKIESFISNIVNKISEAFSGWKSIIKWTKRVVGALITFAGLVVTFFLVQLMSRGAVWLINNWNWNAVMMIGILLFAIIVISILMYAIDKFGSFLKDRNYNLWYVKLAYVLWLPFKWIFIDFLWKFLIVKVFVLFFCVTIIWGGAKLFWRGLLSFLGIFGQYASSSYSDFCLGIDWKEENQIDDNY